MARNFWKSFYQGWDAGDKMYDRFQDMARRRDIGEASKTDQEVGQVYDENAVDQIRDPLEQAGGQWDEATQTYKMGDGNSYAPRQAPKFENGGYTMADGSRVMPKTTYKLDGQTRDTAFTPDEIKGVRLQKMADVYRKYGDPEKAYGLESMADQAKLTKYQIEDAKTKADRAKALSTLQNIQFKVQTGQLTEEEGIQQAIKVSDRANGDGLTFAYEPTSNGTYKVTMLKNDKVAGAEEATFNKIMDRAMGYVDPDYAREIRARDARKSERAEDRAYQTGRDKVMDDRYTSEQTRAQKWRDEDITYRNKRDIVTDRRADRTLSLQEQEANAVAELRKAQAGYYESGGTGAKGQLLGASKDGKSLLYSTPKGIEVRPMPEGVTADDLFPKNTGLKGLDPSVQKSMFEQAALAASQEKNKDGQPLSPAGQSARAVQIFRQMLAAELSGGGGVDWDKAGELAGAGSQQQGSSGGGLRTPPSRIQQLLKMPDADPLDGSVLRKKPVPLSPYTL